MSKQLLDSLESKVFSAVDTIDTLRSEINGLKEERKILEDRLRDLIDRMERLDSPSPMDRTEFSPEPPAAAPEPTYGENLQAFKPATPDY